MSTKTYYETHKEEIKARSRAWYYAHKDEAAIRKKAYHLKNLEKAKADQKAWRNDNKDRIRGNLLKRKYGITFEQYKEMFEKQDGKCAVCEAPGALLNQYGKVGLHVDHNHVTGQVRQLLCSNCNTALGLLKESPDTIRKLLSYVERNSEKVE